MRYDIQAIPTKYDGVEFRSRLEAKWAAMFDLLGWDWGYEPTDFNGWVPDFAIYGIHVVYVEVKPIAEFSQSVADKLNVSGCVDEMLIVGMKGPMKSNDNEDCPILGWMSQPWDNGDGVVKPDGWWGEAMLGRWSDGKGKIGFCHDCGSYHDRISGGHDGGCFGAGVVHHGEVEQLWKEACNTVRWEPHR